MSSLDSLVKGSVLQIVPVKKSDVFSASPAANTFVDITDLTVELTRKHPSSKIAIISSIPQSSDNTSVNKFKWVYDGTTDIDIGDAANNRQRIATSGHLNANSNVALPVAVNANHDPAADMSPSYKLQVSNSGGDTIYINRSYNDLDNASYHRDHAIAHFIEYLE